MATTFRIPKLTDREIVAALGRIAAQLKPQRETNVIVSPPQSTEIALTEQKPEDNPSIQYLFKADSQVVSYFRLRGPGNYSLLDVRRETEKITDLVTIPDEWIQHADPAFRTILPQLFVSLLSSARKELKTADVEAALTGTGEDAWNRYRNAQTAVVNSLQQATETLLIKAAEKNAELDKQRSERFDTLEKELRTQIEGERKALETAHQEKQAILDERTKVLSEREAAFNTKEAGYVARQKVDEQIKQIKAWLEGWSLTKGTRSKRWPIASIYIFVILCMGGLTIYATLRSYDILHTAEDISKLLWWQWLGIWAKSFFPLAAFTTFVIYFIRWTSAWARQHAEEEFRNRTLLIDIGRSSWLLEAVQNAQQNNKEIPPELLRELSRNLFAPISIPDGDIHPSAISDVLLQGLSSIRVKTPDGSEVEANRGKFKK